MYCHCSLQGYKLAVRPPICHILPRLLSILFPLVKGITVLSEVPDSKSAPVTKIKLLTYNSRVNSSLRSILLLVQQKQHLREHLFYCFWQQRKLPSSEASGGMSICKPSAAGFALVKIKMQRESKGRNKSTKKQTRWHTQERERIITKPRKTFVRQDRTCR